MPEELGKVEKPKVEEFKLRRKLYCVPLIYAVKDAPPEYLEKFDRYWNEVREHVNRLEKVGLVNKIYHEAISLTGEAGLKVLEKLNEKSYQLVKSKCEQGAQLEALEDRDLFNEVADWKRCLLVVLASQKVYDKIFEFYQESSKKRYEAIVQRINGTLKEGETGMLLMRDDDRMHIQFPSDIEVFLVHPPALEDINRWFRDHSQANN